MQYAFYCSDRKLVWDWNRYYGWVCLRNPAVYPGALYTFIFSGIAVITYLHLQHLDWQDYLQNRVMDF